LRDERFAKWLYEHPIAEFLLAWLVLALPSMAVVGIIVTFFQT
jgi:hypothetical protein